MQVRLWKKNEDGIKKLVAESSGLITASKLANFAVAIYLIRKKPREPLTVQRGKFRVISHNDDETVIVYPKP